MKKLIRLSLLLLTTVLATGAVSFAWFTTGSAFASVGDGIIQMSALRHDTFDNYYRTPSGAVPAGTRVRLRFRTAVSDVQTVTLFYYQFDPATAANTPNSPISFPMTFLEDRVEVGVTYSFWEYLLTTPNTPAVLYYKFKVTDSGAIAYYSDSYADDNDNLNQGEVGAASSFEPFPAFQLTVYDPNFQTPSWLQNANVYQIFPDRFRNGDQSNDYGVPGSTSGAPVFYGNQSVIAHTSWNEAIYDPRQTGQYAGSYGNQFFGGDLKGVQDKLDYLQSLGFDTLYLTPIFQARSNHRYDTDNYLSVDPALGGDGALAALVVAINQRGMHLILDGVFNHASSDSLYFDRYHRYGPPEGGCESLNSPFRNWFLFSTSNVPCGGNDYTGWFGFDSLPRFNKSDSGYRDFIYRNATDNVIKHWYDRGANGWRFDVADDGELRRIWHEFRPFAKSYKADGPLIGEIWPDASQYLAGDQMDSVMNYRFRKNVLGFVRGGVSWTDNDNNGSNTLVALTPNQFDHALRSVREDYPPQVTNSMLNLLDSHDTNRALFVLTEPGDAGLLQAKERLKLATLFQFTYLGAPMVYYGDEGAINAPGKADNAGVLQDDPYNRAPYPWSDETGDQNVHGPVDGSMLTFYTTLANLRKQHSALRTGIFETLLVGDTTPATSDDSTYVFVRADTFEVALVALNNGDTTNTATIVVNSFFGNGTVLQDATSAASYTVSGGNVAVTLAARTGVVLLPQLPATSAFDFSSSTYSVNEGDGSIAITVSRNGDASAPATVDYATSDGTAVQKRKYTIAEGTLAFGAGETSKTFTVLITDGLYVEGDQTVNLSLRNPSGAVVIAAPNSAILTIVDNDSVIPTSNPTDDAQFFVRQHYYDFLSRVPDGGGLTYWTSQITQCGNDLTCTRRKRIDVSNAFFYELEYQQTGAYVFRLYRAAFGNIQPFSNPNADGQYPNEEKKLPSYAAFASDRARVKGGSSLAQTQLDLANAFVQRAEFVSKYPANLDGPTFVDTLLATVTKDIGVDLKSQRQALISLYNQAGSGNAGRGVVMYRLGDDNVQTNPIDNRAFIDAEYNRAFVFTQYAGYLRRNSDIPGFVFWLNQVNRGPLRDGNTQHAMVCSFITSAEYQQRFSSIVTHTNGECQQ